MSLMGGGGRRGQGGGDCRLDACVGGGVGGLQWGGAVRVLVRVLVRAWWEAVVEARESASEHWKVPWGCT